MVQKEKFSTFCFCRVKQFTGLASKDYYYFLAVFSISSCPHGKQKQISPARDPGFKFSHLALDLSSKQKVYFSEIINAFVI